MIQETISTIIAKNLSAKKVSICELANIFPTVSYDGGKFIFKNNEKELLISHRQYWENGKLTIKSEHSFDVIDNMFPMFTFIKIGTAYPLISYKSVESIDTIDFTGCLITRHSKIDKLLNS